MNPLVSIIIPTYNRVSVIKETLDSIANQTYKNWECIIVDDGSTDATFSILQSYENKDKRFKCLKRPEKKKKGANACRNYGFEKSKGEYIQWFDSDDIMHSNKIEKKVNILLNNDVDFVVCSGIEFINTIDNNFTLWNKTISENPVFDHIIGNISLHTNGPLFKRKTIENSELFNEFLMRKQEWEYYTRLLFQTKNYYAIDEILYYFRIHQNSINGLNTISSLKSKVKANRLVFKTIKKNKNFCLDMIFLRRHFLHKYIGYFKLSLKNKMFITNFNTISGIFECVDSKQVVRSLNNILNKTSVLFKNSLNK